MPANTYSYEMMQQLDAAILRARIDESRPRDCAAWSGEKNFSARAPAFRCLRKPRRNSNTIFVCTPTKRSAGWSKTPKLVIAALNGHTVGGGLEVALSVRYPNCQEGWRKDRIAGSEFRRVARKREARSVFRAWLGGPKALDLMASGQTFSFEKALELGLVNQVYEAGTFWNDVMTYAKQYCPPNKASRAVGRIKRAVVTGSEVGFGEALGIERELQQLLFISEDAKEGLSAYVDKRTANFKGK